MHNSIQISHINDFIFCPYSIYLHRIYDSFHTSVYHDTPQQAGKIKHENIEKGTYSSAKRYIQAMPVYSQQYNLIGKIDIYDTETQSLIERKNLVKNIYDGYRYQLFAQVVCLREMGYPVDQLYIHSLSDNKRYPIPLDDTAQWKNFFKILNAMQHHTIVGEEIATNTNGVISPRKCAMCIYASLCEKRPLC